MLSSHVSKWLQTRDYYAFKHFKISGLPKPPNVKACFEGPDGLLAGFRQNSIWIDHSTTDYGQNVEFQKEMSKKGAFMLEAPITGGLDALKKGQMAVWVAGPKDVFMEVRILPTRLSELN